MFRRARGTVILLLALCGAGPTTTPAPASRPMAAAATRVAATQPALYTLRRSADVRAPLLFYLPGISNLRNLDRGMLRALGKSLPTAEIKTYTWPAYNEGLGALVNYDRNRVEAAKVSTILHAEIAGHPGRPTYIVCHSGGTGIAGWALAALPAEDQVEQVIFLAPALSPGYDLSPALRHVRGKLYAVTSPTDPVLGTMTKTFGTIDRVNSASAGLNGFVMPAGADGALYAAKLVPMPYRDAWAALGHGGDHIGSLMPAFAEKVLAPLLSPAP